MRAVRLHQLGGPLILDDIAEPAPGNDEVVVSIAYASVNPLDVWVARGNIGAAGANLPWVPGVEATGYLDGQPVLVRGHGLGVLRPGVSAQRVAVPRSAITELADDRHLAAIAGIGIAGITAWHAVHTIGQVAAPDRVVVLGATGGVGALAVQLAVATGARVWGQTGNESRRSDIAASGAEQAVVCDADGLAAAIGPFAPTVVLDALGGGFTAGAVDAMEPRGRLVSYGTSAGEVVTFNMRTLYRKGLVLSGYTGLLAAPGADEAVLAGLIDGLGSGTIRVPIELVAAAEVDAAHQRIVTRQVVGKLILDFLNEND